MKTRSEWVKYCPHGATVTFRCGLPAGYAHEEHRAVVANNANPDATGASPNFIVMWTAK